MDTFRVYMAMYGNDTFWMTVSLVMLVLGFSAGYSLGKEYRQPRDEHGRFTTR